jgi:hypothetical protein
MSTLSTLRLDESAAADREFWHQKACRAYRDGLDCAACDQYEADWLVTDRALTDFQRELRRAS